MTEYLLIAIGFYLGAVSVNLDSFKDQDAKSIVLGIIGACLWPVILYNLWQEKR